MTDRMVALGEEFFEMRRERHQRGAQEYGPFKFLDPDNNLLTMTYEELADACNYLEYLYIRLRLLEERVVQAEGDNTIGPGSFHPTGGEG